MKTLFWWSIGIGVVALGLPVAVFFATSSVLFVLVAIATGILAWSALFARAWYLHGKLALWALISLAMVLFWPAMCGLLTFTCIFTTDCM